MSARARIRMRMRMKMRMRIRMGMRKNGGRTRRASRVAGLFLQSVNKSWMRGVEGGKAVVRWTAPIRALKTAHAEVLVPVHPRKQKRESVCGKLKRAGAAMTNGSGLFFVSS